MQYQDRDRLGVSMLLATSLHMLLFSAALFLPWWDFEPFPEPDPIILVELEEFVVRKATETPSPAAAPITETAEPAKTPEPPAPAPVPETPPPAAPPEAPKAAVKPPPAPRPAPKQPAPAKISRPGSSETMPKAPEATSPPPPTGPAFEAGAPVADPRLAEEIAFLETNKAGLIKWLNENPALIAAAPEGTETGKASEPPREAANPLWMNFLKDLANTERELANKLRQAAASASASSEPSQSATTPSAQTIRDARRREIGVGLLDGRNPAGGLDLDLGRADFDGNPPPRIEIFAEFTILESGNVDPASLKISGDPRYTKATDKIRTALRAWHFNPVKGMVSRARIAFEIKSADVR